MIIPDAYRDELYARLAHDLDEEAVAKLLALLNMDMPVDMPPDLSAVPERGDRRHCVIPFTASFEVFGTQRRIHCRYVHVAMFEGDEEVEDVRWIEALLWTTWESSPRWEMIPFFMLENAAIEELDRLAEQKIALEAQKSTLS